MISVVILINGNPIMARSCVNTEKQTPDGSCIYRSDTGEQIIHNQKDGAVKLAMKMLRTIKDQP